MGAELQVNVLQSPCSRSISYVGQLAVLEAVINEFPQDIVVSYEVCVEGRWAFSLHAGLSLSDGHLRGFLEIALSNIRHKQITGATPRAFALRAVNYLSDNSFPGSTRITS